MFKGSLLQKSKVDKKNYTQKNWKRHKPFYNHKKKRMSCNGWSNFQTTHHSSQTKS